MRATQLLHTLGQSLWPDNLTAELLERGTLKQYIDGYSITGLTSNPTIFNRAIKQGASYDSRIIEKFQEGKSGEELFLNWLSRTLNAPLPCLHESTIRRMVSMDGCLWKCRRCWLTRQQPRWLPPERCMPKRACPIC